TRLFRSRDQLRDVDDELLLVGADLTDTDTNDIVESLVLLGIAEMKDSAHDLPPARRVRPPIAMPLEHDRRPVVGLDHGPEVRPKRSGRALPTREVRTPEPASYRA